MIEDIASAATAFKTIFDGLRSAISMVRDIRNAPGTTNEKEAELIDAALDKAAKATSIAEAEVAKALGYELCKCEFPPTPMLTVGSFTHPILSNQGRPVFECPKCGYNTAGSVAYTRISPPRPTT